MVAMKGGEEASPVVLPAVTEYKDEEMGSHWPPRVSVGSIP